VVTVRFSVHDRLPLLCSVVAGAELIREPVQQPFSAPS
jgi:hypothetical protein